MYNRPDNLQHDLRNGLMEPHMYLHSDLIREDQDFLESQQTLFSKADPFINYLKLSLTLQYSLLSNQRSVLPTFARNIKYLGY